MEVGLLYLITFIIVYFPTGILGSELVTRGDGRPYEILLLVNAIILPLQGFFNFAIYTALEWRGWLRNRRQSTWNRQSQSHQRQMQTDNFPANVSVSSEKPVEEQGNSGIDEGAGTHAVLTREGGTNETLDALVQVVGDFEDGPSRHGDDSDAITAGEDEEEGAHSTM